MRIVKLVWNKIRWPLFLILWTIGVLGWGYFYLEFSKIKCEANDAWKTYERIEIESDAVPVKAVSEVAPEVRTEDKISVPPSAEEIIYEIFGEENYKTALAVAKAESRLDSNAEHVNADSSLDCGIFQINSVHRPTKEQCKGTRENIKLAYQIYQRSGWQAWSVVKNGKYLAYL